MLAKNKTNPEKPKGTNRRQNCSTHNTQSKQIMNRNELIQLNYLLTKWKHSRKKDELNDDEYLQAIEMTQMEIVHELTTREATTDK